MKINHLRIGITVGKMKTMIIAMLKKLFSEDVIKAIVIALGDYLVEKSSNKLDDKLWSKVKDKLG